MFAAKNLVLKIYVFRAPYINIIYLDFTWFELLTDLVLKLVWPVKLLMLVLKKPIEISLCYVGLKIS